jgi:primosomal protein DnaI
VNSIDKYVSHWKKQLKTDPERQLRTLLSHPSLQVFVQRHPDIPMEVYRRSLSRLHQYVQEHEHCSRCPGLNRCPNLVQGHRSELSVYAGYLDFRMTPCEKWEAHQEQQKRSRLIRSHHIPQDVLTATFELIEQDEHRADVIEAAIDFCSQFAHGKPRRGLYLYGPLGVGKSRIAGAIAQELVNYNVDSLMVYVPEFMRELRDAINEGSVAEKLDALKKVSVLVLDDIGAETLTPWIRDEVLGAVLQYRVAEGLPDIYTSNLSLDELEDHLAHSHKGGVERMKAKRIMERIRHYVDVYFVDGPNWRENQRSS